MKNRVFNAFLLLALVGMMFSACKKEYEQPPIQNLPVGKVYTIEEILALESGHVFNEDASVYGIITADEQSGNLYKCAFMQDRATGAAIELYLNAPSGVRIGDSVRVYLKDVTYSLYANLPQLTNFEADGHIIILANDKPITPAKATIAEINQGKYLAGLVRLENVMFTEQNTFAEPSTYGNRTLADPADYSQTVIVRTSNYANFAYDSLPQGVGNLTAIASVYNSTWQLLIRTSKELDFGGYVPGDNDGLPYYQDFTSSFGTYTTYDVKGAQQWEIDYNTAKMTGYANSTNYENEDWLISKAVSFEGVSDITFTMTYIARYFNDVNHDITVWVSSDYTSGDPYSVDDWVNVPAAWVEGTNWTDFASTTLDLSQFAGKKVHVAVKYLSDNVKAGTIEVQSILIQEGTVPTPPEPPTPGEVEGDGSRENPYSANDIILLGIENSDGNKYWVKDYIVGVIDANYVYQFTSSTDVNTNIILSSNLNASSDSECIPVQLPAGEIRTGLNLADNPGNLGQEVLLYGTLEKYFRVPGVKNVTYAEINGHGIGTEPGGGGGGGSSTEYFNQTLTTQTSFNMFSAYSVEGEQTWYQNNSHLDYGAVMSGFANNVSYANEDWFISPAIDLSGSTNPVLNFEHARGPESSMNVGVAEGYYTVWVTNDYTTGEEPNQEQWVELPILNQPTVKWQFVAAGDLAIPAEFKTSNCRIAFRYLSIDGASATWEVKNVVVKEQ